MSLWTRTISRFRRAPQARPVRAWQLSLRVYPGATSAAVGVEAALSCEGSPVGSRMLLPIGDSLELSWLSPDGALHPDATLPVLP